MHERGPASVGPMQQFSSVFLVDRRGRVLLQDRDEHAAIDPDQWGMVGGHVEPGESFDDGGVPRARRGDRVAPRRRAAELLAASPSSMTRDSDDAATEVYAGRVDLTDDDIVLRGGTRDRLRRSRRGPALDLTVGRADRPARSSPPTLYRRLTA